MRHSSFPRRGRRPGSRDAGRGSGKSHGDKCSSSDQVGSGERLGWAPPEPRLRRALRAYATAERGREVVHGEAVGAELVRGGEMLANVAGGNRRSVGEAREDEQAVGGELARIFRRGIVARRSKRGRPSTAGCSGAPEPCPWWGLAWLGAPEPCPWWLAQPCSMAVISMWLKIAGRDGVSAENKDIFMNSTLKDALKKWAERRGLD